MRADMKQKVMDDFAANNINVLVSTTVVEVGVNVPNATLMLIEDANRFGLAALHQLRGRIGRGSAQSYCIFMSSSTNEQTKKRLDILKDCNDGFKIAEEDLKLRGPGDVFGFRQSGDLHFALADIYSDAGILIKAAKEAERILKDDPGLSKAEHRKLKAALSDYGKIDRVDETL
jgi:RecG-like helicase